MGRIPHKTGRPPANRHALPLSGRLHHRVAVDPGEQLLDVQADVLGPRDIT